MELNKLQVAHLRDSATIIVHDPLRELTELWMDWANANLDRCHKSQGRMVMVENVLPVIWVFSQLYDCPPKVIFNLMRQSLAKRVSLLSFYGEDDLDFKAANAALGEVISELVPVRRVPKRVVQ